MNRCTSWFVLAATASIVGCKTNNHGLDSVLPGAGPKIPEVTNAKPATVKPAWLAPRIDALVRLPVAPSKLQPTVTQKTKDGDTGSAALAVTPARFVVRAIDDTQTFVRSGQPISAPIATALPKSVVSTLSLAEASPNSEGNERGAISAELVSPQPQLLSMGHAIWSYALPVLTGMCVYVIAPLVVDMIKQRLQSVRRDHEVGKPAQAA